MLSRLPVRLRTQTGASSPRAYHTSYPVPVRLPVRSHADRSPRIFGLGFLQTPPRDDALALLLTFGSTYTWSEDFHPGSRAPCPAHTP